MTTDPKTTVITGGADGIGWAMARLFAERGHSVIVADLDRDKAEARAAELGGDCSGVACDVTREEDVKRLASSLSRCDVLINNAGIGDSAKPTLEQDIGHFRAVLDVHLAGAFLCSREIGRLMIAQGSGSIVNISSIAGLDGIPGRNAYGAAKAGIAMMTKSLACEWASHGVRVNAIAPGYTRTALVEKLAAEGALDLDLIKRRSPMGRLVESSELTEAAWFLASPAASAITGAILSVDCGWAAFGAAGDASAS
ncbi:MAG: short-chain dehydrogenase [Ahrensia sp.]|nr:short-chain dehydrogenase [Ahrensia sp.]